MTSKDEGKEPTTQDVYSFDTYAILSLFLGVIVEKAWQNLGLRVKPGSDKAEVDLEQAEAAIDVAAAVFERLKPHMQSPERERLEGLLGDLKLNFVRVSKG